MPSNRSTAIYLVLIILALSSFAGLDYLEWKKGNPAYLFSALEKKAKKVEEEVELPHESLGDIVLRYASELGVTDQAISQYRDNEGILHMMVELKPEQYLDLETNLDNEFNQIKATTTKKQREQAEDKKYHLWRIQSKDKQLLSLLISIQVEPIATPPLQPEARPQLAKSRIAIIMDDLGNSLEAIQQICALNEDITVAILPFRPVSNETARIARENNLEVILHLPLESLNNVSDNNQTVGIIHSGMSKEEITAAVLENLGQVPYIEGVNTHMGSKITSDEELMRIVLDQIKDKGLYFIDSRTTARSLAYNLASQMGIPSGVRHVFLDSEVDEDFIKSQLFLLFQQAKKNGMAIGICHPYPETFKVLRENLFLVNEYDLETVFASEVVQ